jgi:hypothetical protein
MRRGSGFRTRSAFREVLYDSLVREKIEAELVKPTPMGPAVIVRDAEDRCDPRDPLEIARAASSALRSAVA